MTRLSTILGACVLKHEEAAGLTTLRFDDGELRVPLVDAPLDSGVAVEIDATDVAIALSRPMDVSITNRLPAMIVAVPAMVMMTPVRMAMPVMVMTAGANVNLDSRRGRCRNGDRPRSKQCQYK